MSQIHPTAVFIDHEKIVIGENVVIGPNCVIVGPVIIGDGVELSTGVVIGEEAEAYSRSSDFTKPVVIGDNAILREHVVVQRGLTNSRGTWIAPNCYIMHGTHVAHDVHLYEGVTASPYVVFGGHTTVLPWSTLGIQSSTHQHVTVGAFAMIGMHAAVIHDLPPCCIAIGVPARITGTNLVGLERHHTRGAPVPARIKWGSNGPWGDKGASKLFDEWRSLGKRPGMKMA